METLESPAEEMGESDLHEQTEPERKVSILDAIQATNLVPLLDATDVNRIGSEAVREFAIDHESCKDFIERYDRAMDTAMQVKKAKTFPWANASNIIFPLLTQAAIQFQARSYPAIIDGQNVVKCRVMGPDPEGQKHQRADRVAAHMNWQFLNDIPGWEEDTDKLLLQLPIVGCVFRKTWYDPIRAQINSETIPARDLVVNYHTTSFDKAPRFTHVQRYYPHEIEAFIRTGLWEKVPYQGEDGGDPHSLVEMYEQCRLIDMDDDGLPEPYVVTVTPDGAVARIVACYDQDGIFIVSPQMGKPLSLADVIESGSAPDDVKILRIDRKDYFTKYGFIPAPDGSFYDIGFGTLTENLGAAINTIINQLIDAGTLSNMQGGFVAGGTKIKGGNMRFSPGEWKRVEGATAGPLRDNILPLQLPGPSPTLFQLLGMLVEAVQQITSVSDILSGNQDSQTAPTTALALIEQGQKVFTAIYKRIHRALGKEAGSVFRLNRDYLDEDKYFALGDDQQAATREDYNDRDLDILPVSDPTAINDRVKMAKAQVLMGHNGDPLVNQEEIRKREFEAAGIENIPALMDVPELPPPPDLVANAALTKAQARSADAATVKTLIEAATSAYSLGMTLGDANITNEANGMLAEALTLADSIKSEMSNGGQPADGPGGVPGMEGQPVDAGVQGLPGGLSDATGDGMGLGTAVDPAGPAAG